MGTDTGIDCEAAGFAPADRQKPLLKATGFAPTLKPADEGEIQVCRVAAGAPNRDFSSAPGCCYRDAGTVACPARRRARRLLLFL